ncbi:hypothetical protein DS2_07298 [Catenovulum agarivorans DS-2]|uniref:DNA gyrase subunit B n=1 Tax=Catenovulum agarivorans DS-2 TaxID=1328313 RepID=W7QCK2_9ALTE|nr:hypothetical protein [Catenovulum agarivorans]EWH10619.1 hypothetical protein DS2_07298 [Catenovulum agarivorans DS-2]
MLAYPFLVYFGIQSFSAQWICLLMLIIVTARYGLFARSSAQPPPALKLATVSAAILFVVGGLFDSEWALKFYPVVINLSLASVFIYSVYKPPTVVTLIAQLREKTSESMVKYTSKVTQVWSVFFLLNACVATWSIFYQQGKYWLIYNGFLSYLLCGLLFVIEWIVRQQYKKRHEPESES